MLAKDMLVRQKGGFCSRNNNFLGEWCHKDMDSIIVLSY